MPDEKYRRLTRSRSRGRFTVVPAKRSSLWLGKDHLLKIDSAYYSEEYKRFYFRDVQGITILETKRRAVWNFVLSILLIAWVGVVISEMLNSPGFEPATTALFGAWFLILAMPLLGNNVLGPTSTAYLRTAVQTEELPSLSRVRRARKVLDRIRPLITATQGQLTPEEVSSRMRETDQPTDTSVDAATAVEPR